VERRMVTVVVKVDKRYSTVLFGALMSLGMSFSMSLVLTFVNLGFVPGFLEKWMRAFATGFVVSFPTSLVIIPLVRKIVNRLTME